MQGPALAKRTFEDTQLVMAQSTGALRPLAALPPEKLRLAVRGCTLKSGFAIKLAFKESARSRQTTFPTQHHTPHTHSTRTPSRLKRRPQSNRTTEQQTTEQQNNSNKTEKSSDPTETERNMVMYMDTSTALSKAFSSAVRAQ